MISFNELIQSDRLVLADFSAEWCGPCKMMPPILKDVKTSVGDQASIVKVDIDKHPEIAQQFQISGVPTLILFKQGKILWRQSGVVSAIALKQVIKQHV